MDDLFDEALASDGVVPQSDMLLIFSTVEATDDAVREAAVKRRKGSSSEQGQGAGSSSRNPSSAAKRVVSQAALIQKLVSGGRGIAMYTHEKMIKSTSHYFAAWLDRWQAEQVVTEQGLSVLVVPVNEEELVTHRELMRVLMCGHLSCTALRDPELLLQVAWLAHRVGVLRCLAAAATALAAFHPNELDEQVACGALQLLEASAPEFTSSQLHEICTKSLMQLYEHAALIVRFESDRERFCALPFAAVHAWAHADDLHTDSEDSVLVLLNLWVHGPQGQGASEEQKEWLSDCVRVMRLSPWFIAAVLPEMAWFRGPPGWEKQLAAAMYSANLAKDGQRSVDFGRLGLSEGWVRPDRLYTTGGTRMCIVSVPSDELVADIQQVLRPRHDAPRAPEEAPPRAGSPVFHQGLMWQAAFQVRRMDDFSDSEGSDDEDRQGPGPYCHVGLHLLLSEQQLLPGVDLARVRLPVPVTSLAGFCNHTFYPQEKAFSLCQLPPRDGIQACGWVNVVSYVFGRAEIMRVVALGDDTVNGEITFTMR